MTQISRRRLKPEHLQTLRSLFKHFLNSLKGRDADFEFLELFLTPTELTVLSKRFAALFLIHQQVPIRLIADYLKLSTSTVSNLSILYRLHQDKFSPQMNALLRRRELKETFEDFISIFIGKGPLPPYGGNWGEWFKQRHLEQVRRSHPLRI